MKWIRVVFGIAAFTFLVSGGFASFSVSSQGEARMGRIYPLILESDTGWVKIGKSYDRLYAARLAAWLLQWRDSTLRVTVSQCQLFLEQVDPQVVYPLLVHKDGGGVYVDNCYTSIDTARSRALNLPTDGGNVWVTTSGSAFVETRGLLGRSLGLDIPLLAETVLDGTVNTVITWPAAERSGPLQSPDVRFVNNFETIVFTWFMPDDADWLDAGNAITVTGEYSPDSGGSWLYACQANATFGVGRPLGKDGNPLTGGSLGCSGRDENNQFRLTSTFYRLTGVITGSILIGGEIRIPPQ